MIGRYLIPLFALCVAQAQTIRVTGPATAKPGDTVTISFTATGAAADTGAAGLQWKINLPPTYVVGAPTIGAASTTAQKTTPCTTDNTYCLVIGMNATIIPNGIVAMQPLVIPASAAPGAVSLPLTQLLGVTPSGNAMTFTSGPVYSITITIKQDLNGDGRVDIADLQLMTAEIMAAQSNPAACVHDMTGDGKCDLLDAFNVVMKALGI